MKKATKSIFILIILGAFALTGGGCGKEEEEFDFSMHMRINEHLDQIDWSSFEPLGTSIEDPPGIYLDKFEDGSVTVVDEESFRITGAKPIFLDFKVILNG
jgi:hypothetical protein